jgi:hypothetical protein
MEVTGYLLMNEGEKKLRYKIGDQYLPHSIINVPKEGVYVGV